MRIWRSSRAIAMLAALCSCALAGAASAQPAESQGETYDSDYVVFVASDGEPLVALADFNRSWRGGPVEYEYKLMIGRPSGFPVLVYDTFEGAGDPSSIPAHDGLSAEVTEGGVVVRSTATSPAVTIALESIAATHRVEHGGHAIEHRFGPATAELDGVVRVGVAVWEVIDWEGIRGADLPSFGDYDWIVLADSAGGVWLMQHGAGEAPFLAHYDRSWAPASAGDLDVSWVSTAADQTSGRRIPDRWRLAAPSIGLSGEVSTVSMHLGHGPPGSDGLAAAYGQMLVQGQLDVGGRSLAVTGMVEHIQD